MGRALWIPDKLREYGLKVVEVDGWQNRGSSDFDPRGLVCHHTASAAGSDHPALGIVVNGRSDLPGPLCHVLLSRNGTCYVVASGRANHAGEGGWRGLSGNSSVLGIEAENNGVGESWDSNYDEFVLCAAALADGAGFPVEMIPGHKEWTSRKIDPAGIDMNEFRNDVRDVLEGGSLMGAKEEILNAIFKSTVANLKAHEKTIKAVWVTRNRLREAGILPVNTADDSEVQAALEDIQNQLKELGEDE